MGSTNFTEHYDIPLPLGSDKTTPMDYNQSMTAVDTALFTAVGNSQSAVQSVTALAGTVTDLGEDVTALAGRVTQAESTIGTQGQAIQSNANRIEEVEDDALDMVTAVDEGTAQVASVAVNKDKYFRYNNVLYMATQNISVGDTIVPNSNCRATNVGTELESQAGEINEVKSDLTNKIVIEQVDHTIENVPANSDSYWDMGIVASNVFFVPLGSVITGTPILGSVNNNRYYRVHNPFGSQQNLPCSVLKITIN